MPADVEVFFHCVTKSLMQEIWAAFQFLQALKYFPLCRKGNAVIWTFTHAQKFWMGLTAGQGIQLRGPTSLQTERLLKTCSSQSQTYCR